MCLILKSIGFPSGIEKINFNITYKTPSGEESTAEYTNTTNGIKISKDGEYTITASSEDMAGNVSESSNVLTVKIDQTPPDVPEIKIISGTLGNNGYYISDVKIQITLGGDNYSGTSSGHYDIYRDGSQSSGGSFSNTTITLSVDGEYVIKAYNTDKAGNASVTAELTLKIDQTAPNKPKINIAETPDEEGVYNGPINITIEDDGDNYSGVAYTEYKIDKILNRGEEKYVLEGDYEDVGEEIQLTVCGRYEIKAYSVDNAGNISGTATTGEIIINYWTQEEGIYVRQTRLDEYGDEEKIELTVGDFVNYNSYTGGNIHDSNTWDSQYYYEYVEAGTQHATKIASRWIVLGTDENGRLMLASSANLSSSTIEDLKNNDYTDDLYILNNFLDYDDDLDNDLDYTVSYISDHINSFGNGEFAKEARSITIEDLNKITRYDPEKTGTGKPYGYGTVNRYNRIVKYSVEGSDTTYIISKITDWHDYGEGSGCQHGDDVSGSYTKFNTPPGSNLKNLSCDSDAPLIGSVDITSTFYKYYPKTLTNRITDSEIGIDTTSLAYKFLFDNGDYILNSRYCLTGESYASWGFRSVKSGLITGTSVFHSNSTSIMPTDLGLRAVVTMSSKAIVNKWEDANISGYEDYIGDDEDNPYAWQLEWIDE